ncbi:MAG: hypothetical protein ACOYKJ_06835 [Candidatus Howiella sp.]|jgi:hypothetical protein
MILHTVVPFSCVFPEEGQKRHPNGPPPSTDPADYLKETVLPGGILPGEPLPDPADKSLPQKERTAGQTDVPEE